MSQTAETSLTNDDSPKDSESSVVTLAKRVFRAWEQLRILYIVILGAFVMMLTIPGVIHNGSQLLTIRGIITITEGALIANICYFAGPIFETYVRWLGYKQKWVRSILFVSGTLLSVMLGLVSLASAAVLMQN